MAGYLLIGIGATVVFTLYLYSRGNLAPGWQRSIWVLILLWPAIPFIWYFAQHSEWYRPGLFKK